MPCKDRQEQANTQLADALNIRERLAAVGRAWTRLRKA
jgi:hypothetical protein